MAIGPTRLHRRSHCPTVTRARQHRAFLAATPSAAVRFSPTGLPPLCPSSTPTNRSPLRMHFAITPTTCHLGGRTDSSRIAGVVSPTTHPLGAYFAKMVNAREVAHTPQRRTPQRTARLAFAAYPPTLADGWLRVNAFGDGPTGLVVARRRRTFRGRLADGRFFPTPIFIKYRPRPFKNNCVAVLPVGDDRNSFVSTTAGRGVRRTMCLPVWPCG